MSVAGHTRHTIGVIVGFHIYEGAHPNRFAFPIIRGIQTAACDQGVNIIVACGVARGIGPSRHRPAWPEPGDEEDFVPVGPWNTDGLLILVPLRSKARILFARQLVEQEFPVLFVGADAGPPALIVDNEGGIRQLMEHLVGHGHREIGFIAGDEQDLGDSIARISAYRQGIRELGLKEDPRLIENGQHWDVGGYDAMRRMLQSGVKFTAVMCSNDLSAIGAMRALREAGRQIPADVAVTGFDDILEGVAQIPPLTSVHYPLFETGYRSLLRLRKRIEDGPQALLEIERVITRLVPRQSCGCTPEFITKGGPVDGLNFPASGAPIRSWKADLVQAMAASLQTKYTQSQMVIIRPLCESLVEDFLLSLEVGEHSHFHGTLLEILHRVDVMPDGDAFPWQEAISILREWVRRILHTKEDFVSRMLAEDLLYYARTQFEEIGRAHV
jgi:DNA-binding LacI/PurR family transcriptional regulator